MNIFHLHNRVLNFTFALEDKTIKDFIPTRCHSLKHLNLNQRSRLRFQSHNAQRILWQLNQNMNVLWTNWDSWINITRTSTLVFMASTSESPMQAVWIFTNIECNILLDIHIVFLVLMRKSLLILMFSCFSQHQLLKNIFSGKPVVYGCEDHRLRVANGEPQEERSRKAKQLFEERQLQLRDLVANAEKFAYSYDDIISDITELFFEWWSDGKEPWIFGKQFEVFDDSILESWKLETWRKLASAQCYRPWQDLLQGEQTNWVPRSCSRE